MKMNHILTTKLTRWTALSLSLSTLLLANGAGASPEFPAQLREELSLDCKPACTLCHSSSPGTSGTASQPFADAMSQAGLVAGDVDTVIPAFEALDDALDSDGDGVGDKDELVSEGSSDPNVSGVGAPCAAEIRYGCSVAKGTTQNEPTWLWALLTGGLLLMGARVVSSRRS